VWQLFLQDHKGSLKDPYIDTWSQITNYHSDCHIGSTFRICSPISQIFINWPSYKLIHNYSQAKHEYHVYHVWIKDGRNFSIYNGHTISAGNLIPSCRPNDHLILLQWFIPDDMMCRQYQTTMASWDMQSHIRDELVTNNQFIGALSTEWTWYESTLISTTPSWSGRTRHGIHMPQVAQDTLHLMYGKTTLLQITVYLASKKGGQIEGSGVCRNCWSVMRPVDIWDGTRIGS